MRTYIEACIDRVIAASLAAPDFDKPKRYIADFPICLVGFIDKRKDNALREPLLVDEVPRITMSEFSPFPYAPILISSRILINEAREVAAPITKNTSDDHFYYRHDLAYHYESTVGKSIGVPHDFSVPVRYCWFLPVKYFKPIFFEELDFVIFRILHDHTLFNYTMPGIIQQLKSMGGYDDIWATTMLTLLDMVRHRRQTQQLVDKKQLYLV